MIYNCEVCGTETSVKESVYKRSKHHFCSTDCKAKWQSKQVECVCEICGKKFAKKECDYLRHSHHYCSQECSAKGNHVLNTVMKKCETCGREMQLKKSSSQRFCSTDCQAEWQKQFVGELSPNYTRQKIRCMWCGNEYDIKAHKLNKYENHFCSKRCRQEWYSKEWSQNNLWREESRRRALSILKSGKIPTIHSTPQIVLDEMLSTMGIDFQNEYAVGSYSVDNYLSNDNLFIEVMGDYWHCSPMKYACMSNMVQQKSVIRDRKKLQTIKELTGRNVLYLWETDLKKRPQICELLIREFIKQDGFLENYHSFNYTNDNGALIYNPIKIAYQDMSESELEKHLIKVA